MTHLPALLPVATLGLLWWLVTLHREVLGLSRLSRRGTFVVSFIGFEAVLVTITEIASIGQHLSTGTVVLAWLVVAVALSALLVATAGIEVILADVRAASPHAIARYVRDAPRPVVLGAVTVGGVLVALSIVGWLYVPNNSDSLVYHLPRVVRWAQQSSVQHFATHYTAQIEFSPLHEFNLLHAHLLSGGERLDGFVQLLGFVVCIIGASEVARLLGASVEAQMGAAVITAVIPSAVLQATSTQNDVFAAAVGIGLVVVLLGWIPGGRWLAPAIVLGLGVGLAAIVKGVLPPLIGPLLLILVARQVWLEREAGSWRAALRRVLAVLAVVLVCIAVVAAPFLKRNHDVFGTVTGPVSSSTVNDVFSERAALGNVIRSVVVNFRIGDGTSGVDTLVQRAVLGAGREVFDFVGASQDDQRFVIGALSDAFERGDYRRFSRIEEYGGNPWHVVLLTIAGGLFVYWSARGDRSARLPALMAVGLAVGFVAFSSTAKWSLFVARYQLPLLVVWAPLIAIALSRLHRFVLRAAVVLLVAAAIPQLVDNWARSLLHYRSDFPSDVHEYFLHPGGDGFFVAPEDYVGARDVIARTGCERLGIGNWVLLEYPIWVGLDNAGWEGEIQHIDVDNASGVFEDADFAPCVVIRQSVGRPPKEPPPGWVDLPFGDLTVSLSPEAQAGAP